MQRRASMNGGKMMVDGICKSLNVPIIQQWCHWDLLGDHSSGMGCFG